MKKTLALPLVAVAGGAAAFLLRLLQNQTGFEAETGLPIPGNLPGIALLILLAVVSGVLVFLVRQLPQESDPGPAFPAAFQSSDRRLLVLPVAGVFLIALSGLVDLAIGFHLLENIVSGFLPAGDSAAMFSTITFSAPLDFSSRAHVLMGLLSMVTAGSLFYSISACRARAEGAARFSSVWLLVPAVALVLRLVLTYRIDSINPALAAYYVELLAMVFLTLAFYRLSSFAFQAGRTSRFALYACGAVILSAASLSDTTATLSSPPLYLGCAAVLLGFLLLRLKASPGQASDCDSSL